MSTPRLILFVGEERVASSPLGTWANALERVGVQCVFLDCVKTDIVEWLKKCRVATAVVYQGYQSPAGPFLMRQLAIATLLGAPLVRKWSGSDVLMNLQSKELCQVTQALDKIVSLNLSSEHQGLIDELASIDITAHLIPQVTNKPIDWSQPIPSKKQEAVLIYLPGKRFDFYYGPLMDKIVRSNPDIPFVVIADDSHSLDYHDNVTSLGWIEDLTPIWARCGLLLRITEHDGFARMIVEALSKAKYVVHNQPLGCVWHAATETEINDALERFRNTSKPNLKGWVSLKKQLDNNTEHQLQQALFSASPSPRTILSSLRIVINYFLKKQSI